MTDQDNKKIIKLEINQDNLMEQFKQMNTENKEQHSSILQALEKLEMKLDTALEKKAGVWVEKVIYGGAIFVITGLFSYLGTIIIRYIEK